MKKILFLGVLLGTFTVSAQDIYLQCGYLMDVTSGKLEKEKTIVVSGSKIKEIKNGFVNGSKKDQVVDLKNKTVLPGLIDLHVHMEEEFNPGTYIGRFVNNEADVALQATVYAKRTLMAGFTWGNRGKHCVAKCDK